MKGEGFERFLGQGRYLRCSLFKDHNFKRLWGGFLPSEGKA